MSQTKVQLVSNIVGNVSGGASFTGIVTATGGFSGSITGTASTASFATTSFGLSGSPNIAIGNLTGVAATFTGNVSITGTLTYEDVTNVDSVGLVTARTGVRINAGGLVVTAGVSTFSALVNAGAGLTVTGISTFANDVRFRGGVIENVSAATTYMNGGNLVVEMDVRNATTYTYTIPTGANIGIVSFKNMPAFTGNANGTTLTCIFTQMSSTPAGTGNTTGTTGIGTNCFITGYEDGAAVAGISTRALVGSGTTVTLSATSNDRDFVSFFVHYTGGTNTTATSYQVYATKNGGFRQGSVGV